MRTCSSCSCSGDNSARLCAPCGGAERARWRFCCLRCPSADRNPLLASTVNDNESTSSSLAVLQPCRPLRRGALVDLQIKLRCSHFQAISAVEGPREAHVEASHRVPATLPVCRFRLRLSLCIRCTVNSQIRVLWGYSPPRPATPRAPRQVRFP